MRQYQARRLIIRSLRYLFRSVVHIPCSFTKHDHLPITVRVGESYVYAISQADGQDF